MTLMATTFRCEFGLPDAVDFLLESQVGPSSIAAKRGTQANPLIERDEGIAKSFLNCLGLALNSSRIEYSPMSRHRMSGPYWTHFLCDTVTDCENKVQLRSIRFRKLVPTLASKAVCRKFGDFDLMNSFRMHDTFGMAPSAVCREFGNPFLLKMASAIIERAELFVLKNKTL